MVAEAEDWTIATVPPEKLEEIRRLERQLGVVLIAWSRKG